MKAYPDAHRADEESKAGPASVSETLLIDSMMACLETTRVR